MEDAAAIHGAPTEYCLADTLVLLVPHDGEVAGGIYRQLRMPGRAFRRKRLSLREVHTILGRGVEQRERRLRPLRPGQQRRPDDVDAALSIDGDGRTVLRARVEDPVVVTDPDGRGEGASAVGRFRERDVANAAGIDMTPGRDNGAAARRD